MIGKTRFYDTFNNFRYETEVRDGAIVCKLIFVQGGFLKERRNYRFFKKGMKLTRAERKINYVGNGGSEDRCTFFQQPGRNRIEIRLFVRAVRENLGNF
jgi:hypothetical protein